MTLLGLLIIIGPVLMMLYADKVDHKNLAQRQESVYEQHKSLLDAIGTEGNPLVIRELRARAETLAHCGLKEVDDIDYDQRDIPVVTTPQERRARWAARRAGKQYVHTWTRDQIEEVIQEMLNASGATREEFAEAFPRHAETMARTYSDVCEIDIEDARFTVRQIIAALNTQTPIGRTSSSAIPKEKDYVINGIEMIPVRSSAVSSVGYDLENIRLYVEFTSGSEYEYENVPEEVYTAFIESSSKGRFVNDVLTYNYEYRVLGKAEREGTGFSSV